MHRFEIEYAHFVPNGTLWHCFETYSAENEDQAFEDFQQIHKGTKLLVRPIVHGVKTELNTSNPRGYLSWASMCPIVDSQEVQNLVRSLKDFDNDPTDPMDNKGYTFLGRQCHWVENRLNA